MWQEPPELTRRQRRVLCMGVDIRLRDDGDRDALVRLLCEQQPVSGYPVRWPLPGPVEGFIFRDRDEIAWVACDADAADGLERDQGQVRHAPILGERAARTQRSGHNGVMTVRVYLLDDHEIVRRGLAELLASSGRCEVVGESGSAEEATRRIPAARPDVAILDGRLPDGTGMEVCRAVRSVDENIRCLILTSYDDDEALLAAILAGASGYVLKQVRGTPRESIVNTLLLRSMQQAVYEPHCDGHFGLAYEAYAHFTSPIRRCPDLTVHRAIKAVLNQQTYTPSKSWQALGVHTSFCERRADDEPQPCRQRHAVQDEVPASCTRVPDVILARSAAERIAVGEQRRGRIALAMERGDVRHRLNGAVVDRSRDCESVRPLSPHRRVVGPDPERVRARARLIGQ